MLIYRPSIVPENPGRIAQRESVPFTRERSKVRSLVRPPLSFHIQLLNGSIPLKYAPKKPGHNRAPIRRRIAVAMRIAKSFDAARYLDTLWQWPRFMALKTRKATLPDRLRRHRKHRWLRGPATPDSCD